MILEGHGGLMGHQLIYLGKLPNSWTDRDQTWHTYTDSSGNGNRLNKLTHRAPRDIWRGFGVTNSEILERCQTAGPIVNKFGTRTYADPSACEWT